MKRFNFEFCYISALFFVNKNCVLVLFFIFKKPYMKPAKNRQKGRGLLIKPFLLNQRFLQTLVDGNISYYCSYFIK
jgi:hypothetical protein